MKIMENTGGSRTSSVLAILVLLLVMLGVVHCIMPYGSATTPDSLNYLDIATNIKHGHGFVATDHNLNHVGKVAYIKQRAWPPLYPAVLSLVVINNSDVITTSIVSAFLFLVFLLLVFSVLRGQLDHGLALIPTLVVAISVPVVTVYTYAWSETLFMPLMLLAIWATIQFTEAESLAPVKRAGFLGLQLAALVLLVYARYIGLSLASLWIVSFIAAGKKRHERILVVFAIGAYMLLVGVLLWSNYSVTGHISGMYRPGTDKSVLGNLQDVYQTFLAAVPHSILPFVVALLIAIAFLVAGLLARAKQQEVAQPHAMLRVIVVAVSGASYLFAIIGLRSISYFDALDIRLLSPAFVLFLMFVSLLFPYIASRTNNARVGGFLAVFILAVFGIYGGLRIRHTAIVWPARQTPERMASDSVRYNNYTAGGRALKSRRALFRALTAGTGVIVADKPVNWQFIAGVRSFNMPARLDKVTVRELDRLPKHSLLICTARRWHEMVATLGVPAVKERVLNLGRVLVVRLPLNLPSKVRSMLLGASRQGH